MQSVTPRVIHSWSVKGYLLTKYSGHSLKGRLEWRETGCRDHGQECVQGNKSNARIWGDLENGSGMVILPSLAMPCLKACKGHEGSKVDPEVSDLEGGSDHHRQGTHSCLADEGLEITCERRGKIGDMSRSGMWETEQQKSNMVGGSSD